VEAYYEASNALQLLPKLTKPTLILYAANDPFFHPAIVPELSAASESNPMIDLLLTRYGGHLGYLSSKRGQRQAQDPDPWWAWNRVLQWLGEKRLEKVEGISNSKFNMSNPSIGKYPG
jgi:predicted alpha/beta-fold hydrolase